MSRILAWVDGANSAVMTKLALADNPDVTPVHVDLGTSTDADSHRFIDGFGPTPTFTLSDAARALGSARRRDDAKRIRETTAQLEWEVAHNIIAPLGWRK